MDAWHRNVSLPKKCHTKVLAFEFQNFGDRFTHHALNPEQKKLLETDRRIQNQTTTIQQTGGIEVLEQNIGHMIMLCGLQGCVCWYHCFYDG